MNSDQIQQIVDEVLEGNEERIRELPKLMEDESFRKQYLSLMIDESLLTTAVELETQNMKFKKAHKKPVLFKYLCAVAALITCAFILIFSTNESGFILVAEGSEAHTAGTKFKVGESLKSNSRKKLILEFADKSKVSLQGPFSVTLKKNGVHLENGYLSANIRKREQDKFFVETAQCKIEVIGTQFSVSVHNESTQLKVIEGEVKIEKEEKSLRVLQGEFALASSSVPFKVYKQKEAKVPDEVWRENYRHKIQESLQSHDLLCLYTFDDDTILKNNAGNFLHGEISPELTKAKGRHGKAARTFDDVTDKVIECGHEESKKLNDFSAVLWCKANSASENNVLFSQRDFDPQNPGGWSIHIIDGYLTVWLVTGIQKNGVIEWAKKRLVPFPLHQWKQVALIVKANKISVYLDDKKVSEMNIKWRPAKHIRNLTIGGVDKMSFLYQNIDRSRNVFNGIIDEVRLYKRPLSAEEIQDLYKSGKP